MHRVANRRLFSTINILAFDKYDECNKFCNELNNYFFLQYQKHSMDLDFPSETFASPLEFNFPSK